MEILEIFWQIVNEFQLLTTFETSVTINVLCIPNRFNDVVLVSLLLTLTYFTPFSSAPIVYFEHENVS